MSEIFFFEEPFLISVLWREEWEEERGGGRDTSFCMFVDFLDSRPTTQQTNRGLALLVKSSYMDQLKKWSLGEEGERERERQKQNTWTSPRFSPQKGLACTGRKKNWARGAKKMREKWTLKTASLKAQPSLHFLRGGLLFVLFSLSFSHHASVKRPSITSTSPIKTCAPTSFPLLGTTEKNNNELKKIIIAQQRLVASLPLFSRIFGDRNILPLFCCGYFSDVHFSNIPRKKDSPPHYALCLLLLSCTASV